MKTSHTKLLSVACFSLLFAAGRASAQVTSLQMAPMQPESAAASSRLADNSAHRSARSPEDSPQLAEADLPAAPTPNLPDAQAASAQAASAQTPATAQKPASSSSLSLGDLGFAPTQTQSNTQLQALLNKRTHMLKVHQTLGLITTAPMLATLITGPMAKAKGKNGQPITEPTSANLDFHIALGGLTTGMYWTTAYYAMFAPRIPGVKPKGAIRVHKALVWVHGPGMIATPILGILAYKQENAGEKVHGIASAHGPVAFVTVGAYCASIVAVSWPIHWKFWEKNG